MKKKPNEPTCSQKIVAGLLVNSRFVTRSAVTEKAFQKWRRVKVGEASYVLSVLRLRSETFRGPLLYSKPKADACSAALQALEELWFFTPNAKKTVSVDGPPKRRAKR